METFLPDSVISPIWVTSAWAFSNCLDNFLTPSDGKVNSNAAEALIEAKIGKYIRENGINFVSDWPSYITAIESRGGLKIDQDLEPPIYKDSSHHDYSIYQLKIIDK